MRVIYLILWLCQIIMTLRPSGISYLSSSQEKKYNFCMAGYYLNVTNNALKYSIRHQNSLFYHSYSRVSLSEKGRVWLVPLIRVYFSFSLDIIASREGNPLEKKCISFVLKEREYIYICCVVKFHLPPLKSCLSIWLDACTWCELSKLVDSRTEDFE